MSYVHQSEIAQPVADLFAWHERPGGFARLSPPWLPAQLVHEADSLRNGQATVRLPLGLRAVARHVPRGYRPEAQFADRIVVDGIRSLPAAAVLPWRHRHEFEALSAGTSRMTDRVFTPLGERLLRPVFRYRHAQLEADLAAHSWRIDRGISAQTIALTGTSGLVGNALAAFLSTGGHRVIRLARGASTQSDTRMGRRYWDPSNPDPALLDGVDAVVHLAGASIFGRFTEQHRREIRNSRVSPTRALAELAARAHERGNGPHTLITASAIGAYGAHRGDELLGESSAGGEGFLASVVSEWEGAAHPAAAAGIRTAHIRTGIVQSAAGGVLGLLRPLFSAGLGGPIGSGEHWQSWIELNDLVEIYHRALFDPALTGPVNAVAPHPVRQQEYAQTLARVLRRPAALRVPAFAPAALLGRDGAAELALASQRVVPAVLESVGHTFRFPTLEPALRHQLGRL